MKNNVLNIILSAPKTTVLALSLSFFISSCHHKKDVEDKITIKSTSSNKVAIVAQKLSITEKEVRSKLSGEYVDHRARLHNQRIQGLAVEARPASQRETCRSPHRSR